MRRPQAGMLEDGRWCPWALPRLSWATLQRCCSFLLPSVICCCVCWGCFFWRQQMQPEPPEAHIAELQLNLTGPQKDPTPLRWAAGPNLGRSFILGLGLDNGQLQIHHDGIYSLHIQVTLANCSSVCSTAQHKATVTVGICSPATHSISLLRLHFQQGCTVASHRMTPLALGDILCTNLTPPLPLSPNADETFFGVHRLHP